MTPTIHHIVDGNPVCGKAGIGYRDYDKVCASERGCKDCLDHRNYGDSMVKLHSQVQELRLINGTVKNYHAKNHIETVIKNMEVILNKFVK